MSTTKREPVTPSVAVHTSKRSIPRQSPAHPNRFNANIATGREPVGPSAPRHDSNMEGG